MLLVVRMLAVLLWVSAEGRDGRSSNVLTCTAAGHAGELSSLSLQLRSGQSQEFTFFKCLFPDK